MSPRIPIYKIQDATYRADSCRRLMEAAEAGQIQLDAVVHGHYPGRRLPKNALPGLKALGYWDAARPQSWGLDWHQNEGIELCLLDRGQLQFAVEGQAFTLQPNDLTITRPWQRHRLGDPNIGPGRLHWAIIDVQVRRPHQSWKWPDWVVLTRDDLQELTELLRQNEQPVWHQASDVGQCFGRIADVLGRCTVDGSIDVSWLTLLMNELLLQILSLLRSRDVSMDASLADTQRTVQLFLDDLRHNRDHLAEPWTIKMMAEACGLGITRFTDYCRRLTNTTPVQYLNQLRLSAAVDLLREHPEMSNGEVAKACGFSSPQYFATVFRRQHGCSPQQYASREHASS
ncbi:AraC family transcriptional regulator [Crateriforma conspicua]|uniref:HTH-type transcriptional activator RhaS n=1 Tax=Crateriforma conspicua TaxID=2527996 RepID=A0A5C5XZR7_9PLAN|nr:AraC family transcriptional regulator [Crateriforma conspicua]TWT68480.1 HTH-type transcriptional activator RhaS [Crateriforma conspicua]